MLKKYRVIRDVDMTKCEMFKAKFRQHFGYE